MLDRNQSPASPLTDIQDWLHSRTGADLSPISEYVEAADLDSFDVMELVLFLEERFAIRLQPEDFSSPRFLTLQGLAGLVQARIQASGTRVDP